MAVAHSILELRIGRDTKSTVDAAYQLFAALPSLRNQWWYTLLHRDERLSFEYLVQNQSIYCLCHLPTRLLEYTVGVISSTYPEISITQLQYDPASVVFGDTQATRAGQYVVLTGSLILAKKAYLPLKTFQEFGESDPLAPLFSTLSKAQAEDFFLIQVMPLKTSEGWKTSSVPDLSAHPQQQLIQKKLTDHSMLTTLRIAVRSNSAERVQLLMDSVASAFRSVAASDGNHLTLRKPLFFSEFARRQLLERATFLVPKNNFSLSELATVYHLPTSLMAHIPNIAWGKQLQGEPPEALPVVSRDLSPELKREINPFAKTEFKNQQVIYGIKRPDRRRHLYVIGKTGTGKSTLLANMANKQPRCKHAGYGALTAKRQTIQGWCGVLEYTAYPGS